MRRLIRVPDEARVLRAGFAAIRREFDVPGAFATPVLAEAEAAAKSPALPAEDRRAVALFTLDPAGSMDLDQAVALERRNGGYRVYYAIADVAAFVTPGGPLDAEAHARVLTRYLPDAKAPLHPPLLSEGAASLLPARDRPAVLWTIDLDGDGERTGLDVRRALVRSREQLDYASAQRALDAGADERLALLAEIGTLLIERERARGAISLPIPEQEVVARDGGYRLAYRGPLPIENFNAQISLLTGMAAAELMLAAGAGLLRTLPPAPPDQHERLRRVARALRVRWPREEPTGDLIRRLDPLEPRQAALLEEAATLLRGAGYAGFTGGAPPAGTEHAGLAANYAHVTAPLRRLADRYAAEAALAAMADTPLPEWAGAALEALPGEMAAGMRAAGAAERACVDLVEAAVLADRVGEHFDAMAVDRLRRDDVEIQLTDPAVRAPCAGAGVEIGSELRAELVEADQAARRVRFAAA